MLNTQIPQAVAFKEATARYAVCSQSFWMANYHTFGFCSGRGVFGRAIHSIPISKINSEIAIALFCAFDCCFLVPFTYLA
jgi:hypothetical protein